MELLPILSPPPRMKIVSVLAKRILGNKEISRKYQIIIESCLVFGPPPEMKILLILAKIF